MPVICRLLAQPAPRAAQLPTHGQLASAVESAKVYTDVYRYWHGIEFLLAQHQPESFSARWLALDVAGICPRKWQEWEETFDPLLLYFVNAGDED